MSGVPAIFRLKHWRKHFHVLPCILTVFRHKKRELLFSNSLIFKWCHRESNQGHKDFQSFALPLCISLRATTLAIFLSLRLKLFGKQGHAFWVKHYSLIYHCVSLRLHPQLSYPPFATVRGYQAL